MHKLARWKLAAPLFFAGFAAAIMIGVLYRSHVRFEDEIVSTFQRQQLATARNLATAVEEVFQGIENNLRGLLEHSEMRRMTSSVQEALDAHYKTHDDILNSVTIADKHGNMIFRSPKTTKKANISNWAEFTMVRDTGRPCIGEAQHSVIDTDQKVVRVMLPIGSAEEFSGTIHASIDLRKLWKKSIGQHETFPGYSYWVVDDDGEILVHSNPEYVFRTWQDIEREFQARVEADPAEEEAERRLRERVQSGQEGTGEYKNNNAGGTQELVAFTPVNVINERWGVAFRTGN